MSELLEARYNSNIGALTKDDCIRLHSKSVCVIGCGGLGGYIIELLGRIGIGAITCVDGDIFNTTNLNRQLLSNEQNMGQYKVTVAYERIKLINSGVRCLPVSGFFSSENCEMLRGHDLVVDALDSIPSRKALQEQCEKLAIPLIYGAIYGWYAQVSTIMPGDRTLDLIYPEGLLNDGIVPTSLSFTPALAASIQVAEGIKVLLGKGDILRHKLLVVDLLNQRFETISLE